MKAAIPVAGTAMFLSFIGEIGLRKWRQSKGRGRYKIPLHPGKDKAAHQAQPAGRYS
jgi:hypothetical protein